MKIKSTEQLTKDLESIIRRLYRKEDMEAVRKIVESTLEQSEKDRIEQGPSKKNEIIKMAKELKTADEIAEKVKCSKKYVWTIRNSEGIYSLKKVRELIQEGISAEDIATQGNVNLDAVAKLKESNIKSDRVVELLKEIKRPEEIGNECKCSQAHVYNVRERNKIYLRRQVIKLIKAGESPENIATEGNVNLEAVINLKEELDKISKKEKEKTPKVKKIIELSKDLIGDEEIAERLETSIGYVWRVRGREGIYSRQKVEKMLQNGMSVEEIAKEGNVNLEAVAELKENSIKIARLLELLKEMKRPEEIGEECECSRAYVYILREKNKIYSKRQVIKLIKAGESPEEIAKEGNVNLEAVINLRKELEKSSKREKAKTPKVKKIIELSKDLIEDKEIAERLGSSKEYVCFVRKSEGIYSRRRVKQLIKEDKSPEEIAKEGNVNLESVINLREELKKSSKREKERTPKVEKIIEFAKNLIEDREIAKRLKCTSGYACSVRNDEGIYSIKKVTELIELGKSPEEITEEGKVNAEAVTKLKEKLDMEKIRKKEEAEKKEKEKLERRQKSENSGKHRRKRVTLDEQKRNKLIAVAKDLKSGVEINRLLQTSYTYAKNIMDEEGIYTRAKVKQLIKEGKSPEEIAQEGNVNLDAVIELKNEIEETKNKKENRTIGTTPRAVYGKRKIIALIKADKTNEEIADLGNVSVEEVRTIRKQLEQEQIRDVKDLHSPRQQITMGADSTIGKGENKEEPKEDKIIKETSSTSSKHTGELQENSSINKSESKNPDKTNNAILQMARRVKSVDKIVAVLGIPEYTIRNLLRKNNILPREDIISLLNKGEKTLQEIAQESGVNLKALEGLNERIVQVKQAIANNPKRKQAIELLQRGKSENEVSAITRLRKEVILEMKELVIGKVEKPISTAKQQADFKLDMLSLRSSVNAKQQHSIRMKADTVDLKIQKILYKYPELLGRKEYAFFAYAYSKVSEYMKAIDIGEEYLGLDTPSISALKSKIEEVLQKEKEKEKIGATIGDSNGDER